MLDAVAGAHTAVVAGRPPAVRDTGPPQRVLPVLPEEVAVEPGRDVVPGQHLVVGAVPVHVPVDREAVAGHGGLPEGEVEVLRPFLEDAARPPDVLEDRAEPAVASAGDAFDERGRGVVPTQLHAPITTQVVAQEVDLAPQVVDRVLPEPLEGRVGLGHEAPHRRGHRRRAVVPPSDLDAVARQLRDPERVLVHLRRHADQEVELHAPPAL